MPYTPDAAAQQPPLAVPDQAYSLSTILNQERDVNSRSHGSALPDFTSDDMGDNYLGVASANGWPLPMTGTHHTLFGMHIDLRDFVPVDASVRTSAVSYKKFQEFAFMNSSRDPQPLPPHAQCRALCGWYFKVINPWLPVLHKPTFMAMVGHDRVVMASEHRGLLTPLGRPRLPG